MKSFSNFNFYKSFITKFLILITIISLQSCIAAVLLIKSNPNPVVEYDEVKGITRFKKTLFYRYALERNSSFMKSEQLIYKEASGLQEDYKFYDYIQLENRASSIENTMYFIVDGQNFPVEIITQGKESKSEIDKDEEDVLLADSSKKTVITDYEIRHFTLVSIHYKVENDLIKKITNADNVKIRYYAPPEMITLNLSRHKLKIMKALHEATL
ncbi:hypothetical protein [Marivirga sp.]|uniref:hypothetical protein n=1 Tax=Marivirga sp. TaxID=2018662 RepID=UPI002D7F9B7A|nr:hypothetical protein [Marivirga sp.]HET8860018.1 hypothetical protein [Marivirga sp.]